MKMTYGYCRICHKELTNENDVYLLNIILAKPYVINEFTNEGVSYLYCSDCINNYIKPRLNAIPGMNFNLIEKDSNG